jgi:hypothetical protein
MRSARTAGSAERTPNFRASGLEALGDVTLRRSTSLEVQLQSGLGNTSGLRFEDASEGGAVDVSVNGVRAIELRMVEGVERLETEFERGGLAEAGKFAQRHVVVVNSRSIEEPPGCCAERTERVGAEKGCVEGQRTRPRIVIDGEGSEVRMVVR